MTKRAILLATLLGTALATERAHADDCAIDINPDPLQLNSFGPFFASDVQRATAVDVEDDNCVTYVREGVSIVPLAFARRDPIIGRTVELLAFDDGSFNPCGVNVPCVVGGLVQYGAAPLDDLASFVTREGDIVLFIVP